MSKTPKQIADEAMEAFTITYEDDVQDVQEVSAEFIRDVIAEAIEADRAERRIILRSEDGLTPWRVRVDTPYEAYEQVGALLADGVSPDRIVWEK